METVGKKCVLAREGKSSPPQSFQFPYLRGMEAQKDDISQLQLRWARLMDRLNQQFRKVPNLEAILFLIGVRELGKGTQEWTKEQKVDLMHIAICAILAPAGYFELTHLDQEGWPHYEPREELPAGDIFSQEIFLKSHIVDYFADIYDI